MKRLAIILSMVLTGSFLAEAAIPTILPFLVGTPTTIDTGVFQPTSSGACRLYGTTYNTLDDEYMVSWWGKNPSTYEVRIQRLDKDANLIGSYITFSSSLMNLTNPQVAYSPVINEYMLVYEEYNTTGTHFARAQRLDPSGNMIGSAQNLGTGPSSKLEPHVVWGDSRWFVVWREELTISTTASNALKGQFMNTDGKLDGSELSLATAINNKPGRVAYNSASDNFLVVAQDTDNDTFLGYIVENSTGVATTKVQIAKPSALGQAFPDVAADPDPSNPRFLVSWAIWKLALGTATGLECEVQGQFVSAEGMLDGNMLMLQKAEGSKIMEIISSIDFSPESQEYFLGYEFYLDPNLSPEYRANLLDKNGVPIESEITISGAVSSGLGLLQPTVGAGFGGRFLTLWQDGGFLTGQVYESPNYDENGGSINPGPGTYENNVEGTNGDSAINDTLCGGSAVNGNWDRLPESALLIGFLLLLAGYFGTRRSL